MHSHEHGVPDEVSEASQHKKKRQWDEHPHGIEKYGQVQNEHEYSESILKDLDGTLSAVSLMDIDGYIVDRIAHSEHGDAAGGRERETVRH